jgi:hypothetical protein
MPGILKEVLKTVIYHDLFDFPMTPQEIALDSKLPLEEVLAALAADESAAHLETERGFWFLRGRRAAVAARLERYDLAERKFARARRFFRFARFAPFLRAAFVCNTLSRSNAREDSDIDLFLVAAPGRLWLARLFATGLAALLGLRPTARVTRDRLCLSFYASEDALALAPRAIEGDVYLPRWVADLYPVYDEARIAGRFAERNRWAFGPRAFAPAASHRRSVRRAPVLKRAAEAAIDLFGGACERAAKALQLRLLPERLTADGSAVVVSDAMLKFHDRDRRAEIRDGYLSNVESLLGNSQTIQTAQTVQTNVQTFSNV